LYGQARAHLGLGNLHYAAQQLEESASSYRRAIARGCLAFQTLPPNQSPQISPGAQQRFFRHLQFRYRIVEGFAVQAGNRLDPKTYSAIQPPGYGTSVAASVAFKIIRSAHGFESTSSRIVVSSPARNWPVPWFL
jgi:hypothetical protein